MKKTIASLAVAASLFALNGCQKQDSRGTTPTLPDTAPTTESTAAASCGTKYLDLALDNSGLPYLYVVYNTPSNPPVSVAPINGSSGNNIIGSLSHAPGITRMTGITYDPGGSVAWGITGSAGPYANSLIKIDLADVSNVSVIPLTSPCGITLNLSDIERHPLSNSKFYAINSSPVFGTNRIMLINPGAGTADCLSATIAPGIQLRGLAFDCGGKIFAMRMNGPNGSVYVIDPATGAIAAGPYAYPGIIAPGAPLGNTEMGMHVDCDCTKNIVTGNLTGTSTLLTDGLPTALGGPAYASSPGAIKPTVDFGRLN